MKLAIVGQIENAKTGLGKAINDFIGAAKKAQQFEQVTEIDITNNKKIFSHILKILRSDVDIFYFTPSGSKGGNLRDSLLLSLMAWRKKKIVTHFHNNHFGKVIGQKGLLFKINRSLYRRVNRIILLGHKHKDMFEYLSLPDSVFTILRNGIDSDIFISSDALNEKGQTKPYRVSYYSNMILEKGYPLVLELAESMQDNPEFVFQFAGKFFDEAAREAFLNRIKPLKNLTYQEGVYGEEKEHFLKRSHFMILPSTYKDETLPISMLEAIAAGNFIMVTDVGVISEVLNPETSLLLKGPNVSEMQEALFAYKDKLAHLNFNLENYLENFENSQIQAKLVDIVAEVGI